MIQKQVQEANFNKKYEKVENFSLKKKLFSKFLTGRDIITRKFLQEILFK